jgi:hypothetical protein
MHEQFDIRVLLLKIQDLLSERDRACLHFIIGPDVNKDLRYDTSLGGSLRLLDSLFDKAIISDQDCDYLIQAFTKIRCHDAAKRLQGSFIVSPSTALYSMTTVHLSDYQRAQKHSKEQILTLHDILKDNELDKMSSTSAYEYDCTSCII